MYHPWLLPTLWAALPSAFFLFFVYLYLYKAEGQKALLAWTICWFFHILSYLGNIVQISGWGDIYVFFPTYLVDTLRAVFQFIGCYYFLGKSINRPIISAFVAFGIWSIILDIFKLSSLEFIWPIYLFLGATQIYTGIIFLRSKDLHGGKKIAGWIFILWGIHVLNYPFVKSIPSLREYAHLGFLLAGFFRFSSAIAILIVFFEETKRALSKTEEHSKKIVETTLEGIWLIDKDQKTVFANERMAAFFGMSEKEFLEKPFHEFIQPGREEATQKRLEARRKGLGEVYDFHFKNKRGESVWLLMSTNPIFDSEGNYEGALAMCTDITAFKRTESALKESERQLSTLIRNLPGIAYRCAMDRDWTMEFISEGCFDLTGYSPSDFVENRTIAFGEIIYEEDQDRVYNEVITAIRQNLPYRLTYRIRHRNGELRWAFEQGSAVKGENSEIVALEGFISDFTQVKLAEEIMTNSLHEKDVLLKEVHHRVKNYLQVLSSLLSMQLDSPDALDPGRVLTESQNRILSMAYVHESLYGKRPISDEFFPEFVSKLVDNLLRSFGYDKEEIRISLNCEPLPIRQNSAIPIGLILNELVTNVLKHAFLSKTSEDAKTLNISLYREDIWIHIDVSDNGIGKRSENPKPQDSMGLELVDLLTRQLKGNVLDLSENGGTVTRIRFPIVQ